MGIVASDYPILPSPAACPKCGSMDLHTPFRGRRTSLWLSTCRDCKCDVRSREEFTVERRALRTTRLQPNPSLDMAPLRAARDAALHTLNMRDPKLKQMREIGEEG